MYRPPLTTIFTIPFLRKKIPTHPAQRRLGKEDSRRPGPSDSTVTIINYPTRPLSLCLVSCPGSETVVPSLLVLGNPFSVTLTKNKSSTPVGVTTLSQRHDPDGAPKPKEPFELSEKSHPLCPLTKRSGPHRH